MTAGARALVVIVAMLLASTPLSLLIADGAWLPLTAAAAVGVIGTGAALRPWVRPALLVPVAQALALGLVTLATETVTGARVASEGLPALLAGQPGIIGEGMRDLGGSVAPVDLTAAGSTVIVLLMGLVALALDLVAVDLERPGPAGLLLAAFALAPAVVAPAGGPWWTIAGPVAGALLLWALPALLSPRGSAAAATAAAVVLGLGPLIAPAVPHAEDPRLPLTIDTLDGWRGAGAPVSAAMIDDSVSVRRDLLRAEEQELLRYTTDAEGPGYLRLHTLTRYRDGTWERGPVDAVEPAYSDRQSAAGPVEGTARYDITLTALTSDALPAPANIRWADTGALALRSPSDPRGELRIEGPPRALDGASYAVQSAPPAGDEDALRSVAAPLDGPLADGTIVADVPPQAADLAAQVRADAGAESAYDTARAYEQLFRTGFTYDLEARTPPGEDPVVSFLEDRTGYCEQYAATFALMMISQGFPARVAIGFTGGTRAGDEHVVTSHSAHAWPEVWFGPDLGWVRFEPTPPAAGIGVEPADYEPEPGTAPEDAPAALTTEPAPPSTEPAPGDASAPATTDAAPTTAGAAGRDGTDRAAGRSSVPWGLWVPGALGAALLLGVLATAVAVPRHRARRREERWRRALAGPDAERAAALLAWDEIAAMTAERPSRRLGGGPARTDAALPPRAALADLLAQLEARGVEIDDGDRDAARRLGEAVTRARYAPRDRRGDAAGAAAPRSDADRLRHLLRQPPRRGRRGPVSSRTRPRAPRSGR